MMASMKAFVISYWVLLESFKNSYFWLKYHGFQTYNTCNISRQWLLNNKTVRCPICYEHFGVKHLVWTFWYEWCGIRIHCWFNAHFKLKKKNTLINSQFANKIILKKLCSTIIATLKKMLYPKSKSLRLRKSSPLADVPRK